MTKISIITDAKRNNLLAFLDTTLVLVKVQPSHLYDVIIEYNFKTNHEKELFIKMIKQFKCIVQVKVK